MPSDIYPPTRPWCFRAARGGYITSAQQPRGVCVRHGGPSAPLHGAVLVLAALAAALVESQARTISTDSHLALPQLARGLMGRSLAIGGPPVKYHLYDPSDFLMWSRCDKSRVSSFKHSVDRLFIDKLIEAGSSVPPKEAEVFVIPALLSQSSSDKWNRGFCGDHQQNWDQMVQYLQDSPWFQRTNGSDHLILADAWRLRNNSMMLPGNTMVGHFECAERNWRGETNWNRPCVTVGYNTYMSLYNRQLTFATMGSTMPKSARKPRAFRRRIYDVSFIGQTDRRLTYQIRNDLVCSWTAGGHTVARNRFFFHMKGGAVIQNHWCSEESRRTASISNRPISWASAMDIMAESRFFLAMTGDSPTSDRLFNMFDTYTIPMVLQSSMEDVVSLLPFQSAIPWRDIFVPIDDAKWAEDPTQSILDTIDSLSHEDVRYRLGLLKTHQVDASFAPRDSVMHEHILESAAEMIRRPRRKFGP